MVGAFTLAVFLVTFGACYCVWRAWCLLTRWRSAAAFVWSSDYSEAQVADDRFGFGGLRGWDMRDGEHGRFIDEIVQFQDEGGNTRRAQVSRNVTRGRSPDGAYVIWYDPAEPTRATAFGPGSWLSMAFALAAMLVVAAQVAVRADALTLSSARLLVHARAMAAPPDSELPSDTQHGGFVRALPRAARPFALLARFDRPIGWWLLFWPGAWGVALAGGAVRRWDLIVWILLGSIAMRGAGCVYNDIVDRDLDRQVARTATRPLASGAVSVKAAWVWLVVLCLIGLVVLLQLHLYAAIVALLSLAPVAAYPFMKRITWWPQVWLGLVFSWAALVGWSDVAGALAAPGLLLYAGSICWVVGYDTIYALQDREDDALIGVRSSALRMGSRVRRGVASFYAAALALWAAAIWVLRLDWLALVALLPVALHFVWQVATLSPDDGGGALDRFRSNRFAGVLMFMACLVVGTPWPY